MRISIDSREKDRKQRAKEFYTVKECDVTIKRLDYGDYLFYEDNPNNGCIFEYKRIDDYMQSIKNESLFNEAMNQALKYPFHYVIIVGELKNYVTSNWRFAKQQRNYPKYVHDNYARYYGALRRLRSFTTTIEVETEEQAFHEMLEQAKKCLDDHTEDYIGISRKVKTNNPVLTFLTCIKGVSSRKGKAIIDEYNIKTLEDLLKLDTEKLTKIKGIGNQTANKIMAYITW